MKTMDGTGILIGLGSGRCGTSSLASLLNCQPETVCFHEANPSSMSWSGAELTVGSMLNDFSSTIGGKERYVTVDRVLPNRGDPLKRLLHLERVGAIGDVASYYLPYVPYILQCWPGVRFTCMHRDRTGVVESFLTKLQIPPDLDARNHWASEGDNRWRRDPLWDRCFPTVPGMGGKDLADYVGEYFDLYYARATEFSTKYPKNFRIVGVEALNTSEGRREILSFCLPGRDHFDLNVHENSR